MDIIEVQVLNWADYNPRKDRKKHTWFRLENSIAENQELYSFGFDERWVFIHILCLCSKKQTDTCWVDVRYCESNMKLPEQVVMNALRKLKMLRIIEVRLPVGDQLGTAGEPPGDQPVPIGITTNERTNDTNTGTGVPVPPPSRKRSGVPPATFVMSSSEDFTAVLQAYLTNWSELYPDREFLNREVKKAIVWLKANPKKNRKSVKGWVQFFGGWFERSWDDHTTKGPSNKPEGNNWTSIAERVLGALKHGKHEERRSALGDDLYELAAKVGWHNIGQMDRRFAVRDLSAKLKAQWENQGGKQ